MTWFKFFLGVRLWGNRRAVTRRLGFRELERSLTAGRNRAFTLLELLIIVAVAVTITGLSASFIINVNQKKKEVWTRSRVQTMNFAAERFRGANNVHPFPLPAELGETYDIPFSQFAKELSPLNKNLPGTPVVNRTPTDYFPFGDNTPYAEISPSGIVIDPWGNEYTAVWDRERDAVIISSNGRDGLPGTKDDIRSD